ncbi:18595_t:CDS:2 [Dentiscutata erythropus]|uniref:18595_t:CDS:1 n=1 Tax=Dentiscutata erythropus TaxID=1348616 RepID=A0A9N9EI83_9GLOM|nr:18595_t:CDS:2 [Dentiscutata erythropus]
MRPWSTTETVFFSRLYEKHGNNWKLISETLGRAPKECHDKHLELNPGFRRPRNFPPRP